MREVDAIVDVDAGAAPHAPGCAREVAEAVDGNDGRLAKGRDVKRRGQVRRVMFDRMHAAAKCLAGKRPGEMRLDAGTLAPVAQAFEHQAQVRAPRQREGELPAEVGRRVLVDGDVLDVGERHARLVETIADGHLRKAGPVLDAAEALLLGGGDDRAIANEAGRRIARGTR